MEEENSIEEKQEYLRENILEKGFEANAFADFLVSQKGEGASDINNISMDDLRQAVKEFIEKNESDNKNKQKDISPNSDGEEEKNENKKDDKEDDNENKINEIEIEEEKLIEKEDEKEDEKEKDKDNIINEKEKEEETLKNSKKEVKESKKEQKKETKKDAKKDTKKEPKKEEKKENKKEEKNEKEKQIVNILPPEIYGIVTPNNYECKVVENTPLSSVKNPIITVSSPEKKEGGFFSKSYITYLVSTNEIYLNVRRRYTDFIWLHQTLLNLYPYIVIPPIPKKNKIGIDNFSDIFISKRMRYLEKFLNWLLAIPVIKSSKLFYDFLSIENDEDFNKNKLVYQKMNTPMNLIEFYSKDGKMNLGVNKEKEKFFKNISENTANNETLLNNLNMSLKQLKYQFDIFIQKVEEVQQNWEILFVNSTKYFEDINISNTYEKMSKLFTKWADSLKSQNTLIFIDVREYFKYVKNNFREMKSNINNVENVKNEYYKFERFIINKKEYLFDYSDVTKWEFDPNEKTNVNNLKEDKLSALFKMCAKDTDRCVQRKIYYGYYLNQLIEEYERIRNFNGDLYKKNIINFCRKMAEIISQFHKHITENLSFDENQNKKEENI